MPRGQRDRGGGDWGFPLQSDRNACESDRRNGRGAPSIEKWPRLGRSGPPPGVLGVRSGLRFRGCRSALAEDYSLRAGQRDDHDDGGPRQRLAIFHCDERRAALAAVRGF
jgi:hypothetical protein